MDNAKLNSALALVLVACAAALGFNKIHDTDAWMHLSLGRMLWELKGFPSHEVFIYTAQSTPFYYTSWLFGIGAYALQVAGGAAALVMFKSLAAGAAFWVLYKSATRSVSVPAIAALVLAASLLAAQSRLVLRPDIVLLVILPTVIYLLESYLHTGNKRYLYALPLVHLLWANVHSSIVLMPVPFGAVLVGGLVQGQLAKRGLLKDVPAPEGGELKAIAIAFGASFVLSLVNPNHIGQYLYGAGILGSGYKKDIGELLAPIGLARNVLVGAVAFCAFGFAVNWRRLSVTHLLLVAPFCYLPFMSVRFIFLFAIVAGPITARNLSQWAQGRGYDRPLNHPLASAAAAAVVVALTVMSIMQVAPFGVKLNTPGIGYEASLMPVGAVRYMDRNNIQGRVLNPFDFGQYIVWTGHPQRTVFVDARGNIPQQDWQMLKEARAKWKELDALYERYGFESMVLDYPATTIFADPTGSHAAMGGGQRVFHPMDNPRWALVYWDDTSIVLVRRDGPYAALVKRDEYRFVRPDKDPGEVLAAVQGAPGPSAAELSRAVRESGSGFATALLGVALHSMGRHPDALKVFAQISDDLRVGEFDAAYVALTLSGDIYMKQGNMPSALASFTKALEHTKDAHLGLGMVNAAMGRNAEAIAHFEAFLATGPVEGFRAEAQRQLSKLKKP